MLIKNESTKNSVVVLDFEGFRHKKTGFIIKELSVHSNNFSDTIVICPPCNFYELSQSEQKSHSWVTKYLHGIEWKSGEYPYSFLETYFVLILLRFPFATFYAKGREKCQSLSKHLKRDVLNLEDLNCPKIDFLLEKFCQPVCDNHSSRTPHRQRAEHCAKGKSKLFLRWLQSERNETVSSSSQFISKFDHLQLHDE